MSLSLVKLSNKDGFTKIWKSFSQVLVLVLVWVQLGGQALEPKPKLVSALTRME